MSDKTQSRIVIVDDEPDVTALVAYHLRAKGFSVTEVNDPNASLDIIRTQSPDLVILDVMMPDLNGFQICRILRADSKLKRIPIIFLTARAEEADRVKGLESGGDDYVCKPFSNKELVLRVEALLRRVRERAQVEEGKVYQVGDIRLDVDKNEVLVAENPVELTATEFSLLLILMERMGRVQTRDNLLATVWNYDAPIETRTVDTHVRRLREKLGAAASLIETVRGVGYRMLDKAS